MTTAAATTTASATTARAAAREGMIVVSVSPHGSEAAPSGVVRVIGGQGRWVKEAVLEAMMAVAAEGFELLDRTQDDRVSLTVRVPAGSTKSRETLCKAIRKVRDAGRQALADQGYSVRRV